MPADPARHEAAVKALVRELAAGLSSASIRFRLTEDGLVIEDDMRALAERMLGAAVREAAGPELLELLREEGHVCTCGSDAVCRGCAVGFEDRCRFEAALRVLLEQDDETWVCPVCGHEEVTAQKFAALPCQRGHEMAWMKRRGDDPAEGDGRG